MHQGLVAPPPVVPQPASTHGASRVFNPG